MTMRYDIPSYRYQELKFFCLQYPSFKKRIKVLEETLIEHETGAAASELADLKAACSLIEKAAVDTDARNARYILSAVTGNRTLPRSVYRKYFYMLNLSKGL